MSDPGNPPSPSGHLMKAVLILTLLVLIPGMGAGEAKE
ncbi:MAG: hypothetical protein RLZZ127_2359, partial [Planctomycetota bacterium]